MEYDREENERKPQEIANARIRLQLELEYINLRIEAALFAYQRLLKLREYYTVMKLRYQTMYAARFYFCSLLFYCL